MSLNVLATSSASTIPELTRRSANYHPSVWGDKFLAYDTPDHQKDDTDTAEQVEKLKEEIRKMFVQTAEEPKQVINLIDDIQRSGIAYHFEAEIEAVLQRNDEFCGSNDVDDLQDVALCFRLLRQAGHNVSSSKLF